MASLAEDLRKLAVALRAKSAEQAETRSEKAAMIGDALVGLELLRSKVAGASTPKLPAGKQA